MSQSQPIAPPSKGLHSLERRDTADGTQFSFRHLACARTGPTIGRYLDEEIPAWIEDRSGRCLEFLGVVPYRGRTNLKSGECIYQGLLIYGEIDNQATA